MKRILFVLIITTVGMGFLGCEKDNNSKVRYTYEVVGAFTEASFYNVSQEIYPKYTSEDPHDNEYRLEYSFNYQKGKPIKLYYYVFGLKESPHDENGEKYVARVFIKKDGIIIHDSGENEYEEYGHNYRLFFSWRGVEY